MEGKMIDRNTLAKPLVACVTYLGRISIDMPTKPSFFGRPDDLLEQHNNQDTINAGREFR